MKKTVKENKLDLISLENKIDLINSKLDKLYEEIYLNNLEHHQTVDIPNPLKSKFKKLVIWAYKKIPIKDDLKISLKKFIKDGLRQSFISKVKDKRLESIVKHLKKLKESKKEFVLVFDEAIPTPDKDAGSLTQFYFLKSLNDLGYSVIFIPANLTYLEEYTEDIEALGVFVFTSKNTNSIEDLILAIGYLINYTIFCRFNTTNYWYPILKPHLIKSKIIYNTVDLHYLRTERQALLHNNKQLLKESLVMKKQELDLMKLADISIVLGDEEVSLVKKEDKTIKITKGTLFFEIADKVTPFDRRKNIVFIGNFEHLPNVDGILYFINNIWPIIYNNNNNINLCIIGASAPNELLKCAAKYPNIKILGYIEDIKGIFNYSRLSIAPLRYGAGIKGKVGLSLSYGLPCVASKIAAEGMGLKNKSNILIPNSDRDFANKVLDLYANKALWEMLSKNSIQFANKHYSFKTGKEIILRILKSA